jgi:hypothetical protein
LLAEQIAFSVTKVNNWPSWMGVQKIESTEPSGSAYKEMYDTAKVKSVYDRWNSMEFFSERRRADWLFATCYEEKVSVGDVFMYIKKLEEVRNKDA